MAVKEILRMEKIVKQYVMGEEVSTVLKGIDLTVNEGEFLAVLGPSGSGKSTLMNIIGCLDTPTSGDYYLSGRHIFNQDEKTLAHIRSKEIGFIFQSFYLLQRQSALDNVMLPLIYAGMNTRERDQKTGEQVMEIFHELNEEGRTIIMITHDSKIASHAKRIVRILDGNISEGGLEDA